MPILSSLEPIILIVIFTFLIDLIDLRIYTDSFSFLKSFTYFCYFVIRFVFGFAAFSLLSTTDLAKNMTDIQTVVLLPLLAVLASITVLQNFTATIGQKEIINLSEIFFQYKDSMMEEIATKEFENIEKLAEIKASKLMNLASDLAEKVPSEMLRIECILVLNDSYKKDAEHKNQSLEYAKKYIEEQETIVTDSIFLQKLYAYEIVKLNSKYGESLLTKYKTTINP